MINTLTSAVSPKEELLDRLRVGKDLYSFFVACWPVMMGGKVLRDGWVIRAICEHLEEVYYGRVNKLVINLPPRMLKSTLVSVVFPAWCWLQDPSFQMMTLSYSEKLAIRDNVRFRRLLKSDWFRDKFGDIVVLSDDQDTKTRVDNMSGGYRLVAGLDSGLTGDGGELIILDDPVSANDMSDLVLDGVIETYRDVLSTRFNDLRNTRMVLTQQRIHERDLSGYILEHEKDDVVHLCLPMEYELARRCKTVPLKGSLWKDVWEDPRKEEGELLWPENVDATALKRLKAALRDEYTISGQLQQNPSPPDGKLIKRSWWGIWDSKEPPECQFVLQSWDTALSVKADAAYSACVTLGVFDHRGVPNVILLGAWRKRVEFPDLYKSVIRLWKDYRNGDGDVVSDGDHVPNEIIIEDKASGISLIQQLRKTGAPVVKFDPKKYGDKMMRVRRVTHLLEAGRVWLPAFDGKSKVLRPYASKLQDECAKFPKGSSRDFVDALSQALIRLINNGWVHHPLDEASNPVKMYADSKYEREALY